MNSQAPELELAFLISMAKGTFDTAGMFAAIFIVMVLALAAEYLMTMIENRFAKWKPPVNQDVA